MATLTSTLTFVLTDDPTGAPFWGVTSGPFTADTTVYKADSTLQTADQTEI